MRSNPVFINEISLEQIVKMSIVYYALESEFKYYGEGMVVEIVLF